VGYDIIEGVTSWGCDITGGTNAPSESSCVRKYHF